MVSKEQNTTSMTDPGAAGSLKAGERRHATVLFTDMEGFTSFSYDRDPEEVDRLISSVFGRFAAIVRRYGGSVEKYIGDAMVAVFGVPRVHEDDAVRAVGAAWEFREVVAAEHPELTFRTGIHTGLITTGMREEHEVVTGHALAVASRLQTSAEPGGVLISEDVYEAVRQSFSCGEPMTIRVRGRDGVTVARLVNRRRDQAEHFEEPFVGRGALLQELTRRYLQTAGGTSASVILTGEPGMGASRAARRFAKETTEFPRFDAAVITARSTLFSPSPCSAMWHALREALGVRESSTMTEVREAVAATALEASYREGAVRFLTDGEAGTEPGELYSVIAEMVRALVHRDAALFPTVFVIDGIDELSGEERDLMRILVDRSESAVFYLATCGTSPGEAASILPNATVIEVPPLSLEETAAMIMELKDGTPDDEFVVDIHARSGGNPAFVLELIRYLEANPRSLEPPARIQAVVLAGIQTLPDQHEQLLRRLSVMDHPFRLQDVLHICGDLCSPGTLDDLVGQRYLRHEESRYTFVNELVRESIYESLLNHNKQVLHSMAAESVSDDDLPLLVRIRHLVRAERYLDAAVTLHGLRGRITNFDRGLLQPIDAILKSSAVKDPDLVGELLYLRSAVLFNTHAPLADVETSIRDLLRIGMQTQRSDLMGRAYMFLLGRHFRSGALVAARHAGYQALRHYGLAGEEIRLDNVRTFLAIVCIRLGKADEADRLIGDVGNMSTRYGGMGERALQKQDYSAAYDFTLKSLDATSNDPPQLAVFEVAIQISRLVRILVECRSWEDILGLRGRVEAITGPWYAYHSTAFSGLAIASHHLGNQDDALAFLSRAAYFSRQAQNHQFWYDAPVYLAMARIEIGQIDIALGELEDLFIDLAEEPFEGAVIATLELMLRALEEHDRERARFVLEELDALVRESPMSRDHDRMIVSWYRHLLNDDDAAPEALRTAHALATDVLGRPGSARFQSGMRNSYPYGDILAACDGGTR